jgi:hypothetical protein
MLKRTIFIMQFDVKTIQILRNFSTINPSIIFKPGNTLKTISQSKTIMARASIQQQIQSTFAIADLAQFLSAISMFEDPVLEPENGYMSIGKGTEKIKYTFAEPSLIMAPPEKEIVLPAPEVVFQLKNDLLSRLQKAIGIIGAPEIAVTGNGESIFIEAFNSKDSSKSQYKAEIGQTSLKFKFIFLQENIKLLPGDYDVAISKKGLAHFRGDGIEYWVAVEATSTFEDS